MFQGVVDAEVATLLSLKAQYKTLTGRDWSSGKQKPSKTATQQKEKQKKGGGAEGRVPKPIKKEGVADVDSGRKKQTR